MRSLLTKLFPARSRTARRAAATARRAGPQLGIERLDDRIMPAIDLSLSNHVLTISQTSSCSDSVQVDRSVVSLLGMNNVVVTDVAGSQRTTTQFDQNNPAQVVNQIVFKETFGGGEAFRNNTNINSTFYTGSFPQLSLVRGGDMYGGSGTNTFYLANSTADVRGGSGTNLFYPTTADCSYMVAGTGPNVLYRTSASLSTPLSHDSTAGPIYTVGLAANPYLGSLPDQTGTLTASLDQAGHQLTLSGPGGVGFVLTGNWKDTTPTPTGGMYQHTFTSSGQVLLQSGSVLGSFPVNFGGVPVVVTTVPSPVNVPVGTFAKITGLGGLPLNQIEGSGPFGTALQNAGLTVGGNNVSWGIALGGDLGNNSAFAGLPLDAGVPYLYANLGSGDGSAASIGYGGTTASVGSGAGIQVAFDPADPAVFVKAVTGTVAGTWAAGYSSHGVIPFTPTKDVPGFGPVSIAGNLFVSGSGISLGDLPVSVDGSVVVDLDYNGDGNQVQAHGKNLGQLLKTAGSSLGSALSDISFGVNGELDLGYTLGGVDLSLDVGSGSIMYVPGTIGFNGGGDNPFAGTPLAAFAPETGMIDIEGDMYWCSLGWGFSLTGTETDQMTGGLFGAQTSFSITNWGISMTETYDVDLRVATAEATTTWSLEYQNGELALDGHLHADFQVGSSAFNIHGSVDADLTLTTDPTDFHGVDVTGSGTLTGGVTAFGASVDGSVGFGVDDHGFSVMLPDSSKEIVVKW